MKAFIIIVLVLINSISLSQDKLILVENSEVINCEILCITDSQYIFKVENEKLRIDRSKVSNFILFDYDNRFSKLCDGLVGVRLSKEVDSAKNQLGVYKPLPKKEKSSIILSKVDLNTNEKILYYSGLELQKYTRHNRIGLGSTLIGFGVGTLGFQMRTSNKNLIQKTGNFFLVTGIVSGIVGTCFLLESPKHIKNAGLILSGNGVGVKIKF